MYVVKSKDVVVVQSDNLRDCMLWLTSKAGEYNFANWLPGPGLDLLTLAAGGQQWTLSDTREYYHWVVSVPQQPVRDGRISADQILGIFP